MIEVHSFLGALKTGRPPLPSRGSPHLAPPGELCALFMCMKALQVNILLGHSNCTRVCCIKYLLRRPSGRSWTESKFSSPGRVAHSRRISIRMTASGAVAKPGQTFFLDKFAYRQFEGGHVSQLKIEKEDFVNQINSRCKEVSFSPLRHYKTKALLWQLASLKPMH